MQILLKLYLLKINYIILIDKLFTKNVKQQNYIKELLSSLTMMRNVLESPYNMGNRNKNQYLKALNGFLNIVEPVVDLILVIIMVMTNNV